MIEDLQALLPKLDGPQLLKSLLLLAQLGAIRSSKQQQLVDQLLHRISQQQQQLQPATLLELSGLTKSLEELEAQQSQPGLNTLIKKLKGVQDASPAALQQAGHAGVLRLVVGLQQQGKLQEGLQLLPDLPAKLRSSIQELCALVSAATAAAATATAAAAAAAAGGASADEQIQAQQQALQLRLEQQQQMRVLNLQEWVLVVGAVRQLCSRTAQGASILMPEGGEEVAALLQAMLDSEFMHHMVQHIATVPAPSPPSQQQQQQQAPGSGGGSTPPPPPPAPADAAGSSNAATAQPQALLLPLVFGPDDWSALAALLGDCLHWYPLELLPQQLLQLVLEVSVVQGVLACACSWDACRCHATGRSSLCSSKCQEVYCGFCVLGVVPI